MQRWLILIGAIGLAATVVLGMATSSRDEVEEVEYVESTEEENLEGKLGRGADFGHPRIPGANTGYRSPPYPYKQDNYAPPHSPQYPIEYHHDPIYPIEETYYESEVKYNKNEDKYHHIGDTYHKNDEHYLDQHDDRQVSIQELKSILSQLLDDFLHKFKAYKCPKKHHSDQGSCDPSKWSKCTCVSPAEFTDDGRGNCNLGAIKADTQVWCYVEDKHGDPAKSCPDSKHSNSKPGYYWSRYACIT